MKALLFDCDGVLVDTERDGHRVAFNHAFARKVPGLSWSVEKYGELLSVGGGKERMRAYFQEAGWPEDVDDKDAFIKELHLLKTDLFMEIIASGQLPLRPGVARITDEAIKAGLKLAVCSTSNERAVTLVVEKLLGPERAKHFSIFAGDMAKAKKPSPEIYLLAIDRMQLNPSQTVVVEDSRNGLLAAKAARLPCIVTKSTYTREEDFSEADLVTDELGDPPSPCVTLDDLQKLSF